MTQPVQFRQSLLIALLTGAQAVLPAIVAILSLYGTVIAFGSQFDPRSTGLVVVAIVCLVLVQPPREITTQLTSPRFSAVIDVLFRWFLILALLLALAYVTHSTLQTYPRRVFLTWALGTPVVLIVATLGMQEFMRRFLMNAFEARAAIIAGYNSSSVELCKRLKNNPGMRLNVAGFFDDRSTDRLGMDGDAELLGPLADLGTYVKENRTDVIFIALPIRHVKRVMNLLDDLRDTTASIYYVPDIFVFDLIQARSGEIQGIPVVAMCETPFYGYRGVAKRLTDIVLSVMILLLLLPLLAAIAVMVKLTSPGPVIFKQRRYGLDGREIAVYKFRTMTVTEDGAQIRQASKQDSRFTPIGGILRRASLDELPQLINVLQGRMSLVGPRPHAVAHNEEYRKLIKGYMVRHKVLPGITGLAQVNGCRGETSQLEEMEARVNYDLDYLRRWTPMLDIKIILLTVVKVFRDDKAY
ncbi:MAG TPA: undecaprenyl-phosphate glucose phosphotransferase [Steroidobacteraceae bacterium]|jgi:putative colanic acid biosynthesis UDP-glucose lipid carrier transferase|nr:undecaprenyl-phosphate glucose phosphotransferase [Steroidobacteraceae bacterium]